MSLMIGTRKKDPDDIKRFNVSAVRFLYTGDTIDTGSGTNAFAIEEKPAVESSPLVIASESFGTQTASVWLGAGDAGGEYVIRCRFVTVGGEQIDCVFKLLVE